MKHPSSVYLRPELLPLLSLLLRSLLLFLPEEERVAAEFCLLLLVELCERTVVLLLLLLVLEFNSLRLSAFPEDWMPNRKPMDQAQLSSHLRAKFP